MTPEYGGRCCDRRAGCDRNDDGAGHDFRAGQSTEAAHVRLHLYFQQQRFEIPRVDVQQLVATAEHFLEIFPCEAVTVVMVTHDIEEAVYLADKVLVMTGAAGDTSLKGVPVDLPRPRDRGSPAFVCLRESLLGEFKFDIRN